jgi:lipopolysaccharide/colanic/teichoic acid biosynthesis glycosyltransferase
MTSDDGWLDDRGDLPHTLPLVVKRLFDIAISAVALIVVSPLLLLVSLAIKIESRGPVFVKTIEHCFCDQSVCVLKFRSGSSLHFPTRVGRFLIRNGMDRLPMLINVLCGEMSIVGRRCHAGPHSASSSDRRLLPLKNSPLKPGLFSLDQSSRKFNDESDEREIEDDIFYVTRWSLVLDARIFFKAILSAQSYKLD